MENNDLLKRVLQMENTKKNNESEEYYFKVWQHYEQVAMHFNDLIIKLRIQSIGGIAALATVLGIVLKTTNGNNEGFNYGLAIVAILFLLFCWVAICVLDLRYYNRLLEGSVNAILELEKDKKGFFEKKEINLSSNIEKAFEVKFKHETRQKQVRIKENEIKKKFINGRTWFYGIVFFALMLVLLATIFMYCRDCKQKTNEATAKVSTTSIYMTPGPLNKE